MDHIALAYKVLSGQATEEEIRLLEEWKRADDENRLDFEDIKFLFESGASVPQFSEEEKLESYNRVVEKINHWNVRRKRVRRLVVLILLGTLLALIGWLAFRQGVRNVPRLYSEFSMVTIESSRLTV